MLQNQDEKKRKKKVGLDSEQFRNVDVEKAREGGEDQFES